MEQDKGRHFNLFHIAAVYFKSGPLFLGEGLLLVGAFSIPLLFLIPTMKEPKDAATLLGLLAIGAIGVHFVSKKIKAGRNAYRSLKYGVASTAHVIHVRSTNSSHNNRNVKAYTFNYMLGASSHDFVFKSAYHRHLNTAGKSYRVYVLEKDPTVCFISALYFSDENKFEA